MDVLAVLSDDDRQLAFIVELAGVVGLEHRGAVAGLGVGEAHEQGRRGVQLVELLALVGVVHADAEDFGRRNDDRQEGDVGDGDIRGVGLEGGGLVQRLPGQQGFQVGVAVTETAAQIDQTRRCVDPVTVFALMAITCKFHDYTWC